MKEKYDLDKHEFYRYLQLRNYYRKEIKMDPSGEVNGLVQITVKAYKGKRKWESEFKIKITDEDWQNMWKLHQTSTSSRIWREFSWKNLVRFFITPKVKSKQLNRNIHCWWDCGALNADHSCFLGM